MRVGRHAALDVWTVDNLQGLGLLQTKAACKTAKLPSDAVCTKPTCVLGQPLPHIVDVVAKEGPGAQRVLWQGATTPFSMPSTGPRGQS